jgi:hypothetical protein
MPVLTPTQDLGTRPAEAHLLGHPSRSVATTAGDRKGPMSPLRQRPAQRLPTTLGLALLTGALALPLLAAAYPRANPGGGGFGAAGPGLVR